MYHILVQYHIRGVQQDKYVVDMNVGIVPYGRVQYQTLENEERIKK
jgi:hypothetical protein